MRLTLVQATGSQMTWGVGQDISLLTSFSNLQQFVDVAPKAPVFSLAAEACGQTQTYRSPKYEPPHLFSYVRSHDKQQTSFMAATVCSVLGCQGDRKTRNACVAFSVLVKLVPKSFAVLHLIDASWFVHDETNGTFMCTAHTVPDHENCFIHIVPRRLKFMFT